MAITRAKKEKILNSYIDELSKASWAYALSQYSISVNEMNKIRMDLAKEWAKLMVVKKKVFLKGLQDAGVEEVWLDKLPGSVMMLFCYESEYEPLKVIHNKRKEWQKQWLESQIEYLWWWMNWAWVDSESVEELAKMPSRDELLGKFAFLLNYPVQSFAYALDQISQSK